MKNITVMTTKGQIVIPAEIRHKLDLKKGTRLLVEERGGEIVLRALTPEYFDKIAGILPTKGELCRALLEERAKDKERENR